KRFTTRLRSRSRNRRQSADEPRTAEERKSAETLRGSLSRSAPSATAAAELQRFQKKCSRRSLFDEGFTVGAQTCCARPCIRKHTWAQQVCAPTAATVLINTLYSGAASGPK